VNTHTVYSGVRIIETAKKDATGINDTGFGQEREIATSWNAL
jgi:hypothetical protein